MDACADSSFAENKRDDRRSASGGVSLLAGGAISCFNRTQHCVMHTITGSECVTPPDVSRKVGFLKELLESPNPIKKGIRGSLSRLLKAITGQ